MSEIFYGQKKSEDASYTHSCSTFASVYSLPMSTQVHIEALCNSEVKVAHAHLSSCYASDRFWQQGLLCIIFVQ
jgi:hypothetical protein